MNENICLILKRLLTFFIWLLYYSKIDFTVKYELEILKK